MSNSIDRLDVGVRASPALINYSWIYILQIPVSIKLQCSVLVNLVNEMIFWVITKSTVKLPRLIRRSGQVPLKIKLLLWFVKTSWVICVRLNWASKLPIRKNFSVMNVTVLTNDICLVITTSTTEMGLSLCKS